MELRLHAEKVAHLEQVQRTSGEQLCEANERLAQSEDRFRDLFEEARIAYVYGHNDTRIIQTNSAAMRMFGLKPEEIPGVYGTISGPRYPRRSTSPARRA